MHTSHHELLSVSSLRVLTVTRLRNLLYFFSSSLSEVFFRFCRSKHADLKGCIHTQEQRQAASEKEETLT